MLVDRMTVSVFSNCSFGQALTTCTDNKLDLPDDCPLPGINYNTLLPDMQVIV